MDDFPCPRCGGQIPNNETPGAYPGATSRWDNETEVCSQCGQDEGMLQYQARGAGEDPTTVVHPRFGKHPWVSYTKTAEVTVTEKDGTSMTVPLALNADGSMEIRSRTGSYGLGVLPSDDAIKKGLGLT